MPLEITLRVNVVWFFDMVGKTTGSSFVLADFGSLVVHPTVERCETGVNPAVYPFTVTHRKTGMIVDHFLTFDLCCCAARQWSEYDWHLPNFPHFPQDTQTKRAKLVRQIEQSAVYAFGFRSKALPRRT